MSYTPVELRHVRVGRSLFGYNRAMVEQVIEEVAQSFEATWRERGELIERVETQDKQLAELRQREELLTHTLVAAEQAAADVRERARRDAETIVAEARNEAREISRSARAEHERLLGEAQKIEAMLRGALGVIGQAGEGTPAATGQAGEDTPAVLLPVEPLPLESVALQDLVEEALTVPGQSEAPSELPWVREDTREFEPIPAPDLVEETVEPLERLRLDKLPAAEPRRGVRPAPASRDFDWGE